ncbi:hypothetical protein QFC21_000239 [Naganishia friedmannii]|uniref:Uncharacterized protein n=1 Tax=Naganishia friedmannii TaxID=89922 RepID=A0ACC2WC40_9TREE|nr:hypothetical protein QFC21_000239 [Naganishia friedmannii]
MSYSNTGRHPYANNHDGNAYELPSLQHQTHGGGYVRTDDQDDQDDVPIHSRRHSRLGMSAPPPMNNNYPSYNREFGYNDNAGNRHSGHQSAAHVPHMRQSSYGASYTDTPQSQERYDNPFEQPAAQQPDFDIMADFNNAGPRYSNVYGIAPDESMRELVKHGGRPVTSYRPQSAHVDLAKPYRPKSKMGSILSDDQKGEEEYRDSPIERSYSTRYSTKEGKRSSKSRAKPLLADANWDTSRHDVVREDDEDDERWGGGGMGGKTRFNTKAKDANGVELVTVPALGPE